MLGAFGYFPKVASVRVIHPGQPLAGPLPPPPPLRLYLGYNLFPNPSLLGYPLLIPLATTLLPPTCGIVNK